MTLFTVQ